MADKTSLRWNYFTLEGICKAKCGLCDVYKRPVINKPTVLYEHLHNNIEAHRDAINNYKEKYPRRTALKDVDWDSYYKIVPDDYMLNPKLECNSCSDVISILAGTETKKVPFLSASPEMGSHLKDEHQVDEGNWIDLNNWITDCAADYCSTTKSGSIRVYTCKKCDNDDNESRAKNAIMFAKHVIDQHRDDKGFKAFSWKTIPKELLSLYPTVREDTTLSSDIADRPGPSGQGSSAQGVYSESPQFSSKEALKTMSKFFLSTPRNEDVDINLQDSSLGLSLLDFSDISTDRSRQIGSISEIERSNTSNQPPSDTKDILNISQGIQQQSNIIMANVLDEGLQPDMHVPSNIQLPSDPKDIPSTSSGKRKRDTQIEESSYKRKKSNVELIKKYNEDIFKIIYTSNKEIFKLMHEREATIFKLMHEREATIFKLMHEREETIFNKIEEIKKILEEMSKDDS